MVRAGLRKGGGIGVAHRVRRCVLPRSHDASIFCLRAARGARAPRSLA